MQGHLDEVCVYRIRILIVHTLVCRLLGKATFDALNNRHMSGHCADGASAVDLRPKPMKAPREKGAASRLAGVAGRPSAHPDPGGVHPPSHKEQDPLFIHVWSNFCYSYFGRLLPPRLVTASTRNRRNFGRTSPMRHTLSTSATGLRFGFVPMMSELVAVIMLPTRAGPLS